MDVTGLLTKYTFRGNRKQKQDSCRLDNEWKIKIIQVTEDNTSGSNLRERLSSGKFWVCFVFVLILVWRPPKNLWRLPEDSSWKEVEIEGREESIALPPKKKLDLRHKRRIDFGKEWGPLLPSSRKKSNKLERVLILFNQVSEHRAVCVIWGQRGAIWGYLLWIQK